MSASSRPDVRSRGFSLVELLVVMLVVGLVSAVVAPNLSAMWSGVQRFTLRDGVVADLSALGFRAYTLGQSFELKADSVHGLLRDGNPVLALPSGWQLRTEAAIRFHANGTCSGGALELIAPGGAIERLKLNAPDCRLSPA